MKQINGIWLPDNDQHFEAMMARHPARELRGEWYGTYQFDKLQAALKCCKKRRVALDIGAHVGFWSMWLAEAFREVWAFEPVMEHVACFRRNVVQNNVTLRRVAIGADKGLVSIVTDPDNSGKAYVGNAPDNLIAMIPIDYLGLQKVDLIKIDVEGMEPQVIAGAVSTIQTCRPVILVEQKGHHERFGNTENAALDALQAMGMTLLQRLGDDYLFGWKKDSRKLMDAPQ